MAVHAPPEGDIMFKLISFRSDEVFWPFAERPDFSPTSRPRSVIVGLLAAPWRAAGALAKELAARRAVRTLANLDERMLRDIGLERGQLDYAARCGRTERMHDMRADIARWS
jgi:uncharacterized protein YjiS (DUF1127 family)